ncbi:MAG: hypothetical protein ABS35_16835 [Kaistia sp. SCN 65-12]|nr:MAG: hypothetical protein ABS35_16835 [Kaistia sp. SCN 65-12]
MVEEIRRWGGHACRKGPAAAGIQEEINPMTEEGLAMKYQDWKKCSARRKALWPGDMKAYLQRQHKMTISIDAELAEWLVENVVGRSSYTCDLEETIVTALRIARRDASTSRR